MDQTDILWKKIVYSEGTPFHTLGRGRNHAGSVEFTYRVSREAGAAGKHYTGESIPGYGNELWIITESGEQKKSISRSTVNLAFSRAERAKGPKALGVPGAGSYLYPIFISFGIIPFAENQTETLGPGE